MAKQVRQREVWSWTLSTGHLSKSRSHLGYRIWYCRANRRIWWHYKWQSMWPLCGNHRCPGTMWCKTGSQTFEKRKGTIRYRHGQVRWGIREFWTAACFEQRLRKLLEHRVLLYRPKPDWAISVCEPLYVSSFSTCQLKSEIFKDDKSINE